MSAVRAAVPERLRAIVAHPILQRLRAGVGAAAPLGAGPESFERELGPAPLAVESAPVTKLLFDRLQADDVAEVRRRCAQAPELAGAPPIPEDPGLARQYILSYGVFLGVEGVVQRTGLSAAQPPEGVHSMARGPLAAAGGLYEADMVVNAVRSAGGEVDALAAGLDFGCSSGRVLRVLQAAFPQTRWQGCDPNEPAIEWAQRTFEGIDFFVNPQFPPLPLGEGAFGLVYAISIWSHFAPALGLRWFDEMHRLLAPGGYLVFTTHGPQSVAFYSAAGARSAAMSRDILDTMYRRGLWYAAEFGPAGDSGVINPEWGTAFMSPEWVATKLCPKWRLLEYAPGRNQSNQDVYVLARA